MHCAATAAAAAGSVVNVNWHELPALDVDDDPVHEYSIDSKSFNDRSSKVGYGESTSPHLRDTSVISRRRYTTTASFNNLTQKTHQSF